MNLSLAALANIIPDNDLRLRLFSAIFIQSMNDLELMPLPNVMIRHSNKTTQKWVLEQLHCMGYVTHYIDSLQSPDRLNSYMIFDKFKEITESIQNIPKNITEDLDYLLFEEKLETFCLIYAAIYVLMIYHGMFHSDFVRCYEYEPELEDIFVISWADIWNTIFSQLIQLMQENPLDESLAPQISFKLHTNLESLAEQFGCNVIYATT